MYCPKCNTPTPPEARFCTACGNPLQTASPDQATTVMQDPNPNRQFGTPTGGNRQEITTIDPNRSRRSVVLGSVQTSMRPNSRREQTVLVIDRSISMTGEYDPGRSKIEAAQRGSISLILNRAMIDPDDEVGIVTFDTQAQRLMEISPIRTHKDQMFSTIQSIRPSGGTNQNEGLKAARDMFDWTRTDIERRIIMLTDGQGGEPLATAEDLKGRGVLIEVFGIGDTPYNVNEKLLRKVASTVAGEDRYRFIKDSETLVRDLTKLGGKP